jgi:hypothetical protein
VKEKTISVDCRSDSAADGRARDEKNENKKNRVGREQWRETKEKERKNILVSVPGFRNPPFLSLKPSDAVNDCGLASPAMALEALARRQRRYRSKGGLD